MPTRGRWLRCEREGFIAVPDFRPLASLSYASPALDTTNLTRICHQCWPHSKISEGSVGSVFTRLMKLHCRRVIDFSDTIPTLFPRRQNFATGIGVLPSDPPKHRRNSCRADVPRPTIASLELGNRKGSGVGRAPSAHRARDSVRS